jgi:hypothetical protein
MASLRFIGFPPSEKDRVGAATGAVEYHPFSPQHRTPTAAHPYISKTRAERFAPFPGIGCDTVQTKTAAEAAVS